MMAQRHSRILTLILLVVIAAPASAFWGWMRGSAANEFKESDWDLFKEEMRQALEDGADGERFDWSNPKTGNSGSIRILETAEVEGETCRKAAFRNVTAKGTKGQSVHYLCRQENGAWQFAAASAFESG